MPKKELKVGDVVEHWGFDFSPLKWYEKTYRLPKWWSRDFRYWAKRQYQKIRHGFALEESWDFYSHCATWSLPRLKHLRNNLNGHPAFLLQEADELNSTRQEHFDFIKDVTLNKDAHKKWEEILDKIIWSMENHDKEPDPIYPPNYSHKQIITDLSDSGTSYESLDKRAIDFSPVYEHEKRVQEGFELFGQHFRNLWD
jgi:hypothetical protein